MSKINTKIRQNNPNITKYNQSNSVPKRSISLMILHSNFDEKMKQKSHKSNKFHSISPEMIEPISDNIKLN